MKVKTLREFAGVPIGTIGIAEKDGDLFKITWMDIPGTRRGIPFSIKPIEDWFNQGEVDQYLEILEN